MFLRYKPWLGVRHAALGTVSLPEKRQFARAWLLRHIPQQSPTTQRHVGNMLHADPGGNSPSSGLKGMPACHN